MKYIGSLVIIIGLISCRSYREKMRLENNQISLSETSKGMRYGFEMLERDSQNRMWYFATDSVISFHPDYGLFSQGGRLQITESRIGLQHLQVEVDAVAEQRNETATHAEEEQSRIWYRIPWWVWGLGVLCIISLLLHCDSAIRKH